MAVIKRWPPDVNWNQRNDYIPVNLSELLNQWVSISKTVLCEEVNMSR